MLTYHMEQRGDQPLYEYLCSCIRADILNGNLPAHMRLPSKRTLAGQLSVSLITVENAYAQLLAEGYIYSLPRKGYYAADLGTLQPYAAQERTQPGEPAREDAHAETPEAHKDVHHEVWLADFTSNQTDPAGFPFSAWAKIGRRNLSERREDLMQNPPGKGVYELREAIAGQLKNFRGLEVSPEQIVVGAGTEYLYGLLIQLLGFDRVYASENPGYSKPSAVFRANGVKHVSIPLDEQGLSVRELEHSDAQIVHLTPSHHFPTGITMPAARRYELLRWAEGGEGRYLIEDDYDSEFRMSGRPLPPLFGTGGSQRVIYMNTFTKSLASTVRISYMVLPEKLQQQYERRLGFYSSPVPTFEQYVLAAFLREGYFEKHVNRMRSGAKKRRDILLRSMKESGLNRYCHIKEENAGLHFLMYMDRSIRPEVFEQELIKRRIRLRCVTEFYLDPLERQEDMRSCYVVNYSSLPESCIGEAVGHIYEAALAALEV